MTTKPAVPTIDVSSFAERERLALIRAYETRECINIADGETVIARIVPVAAPFDQKEMEEWWERHDELSEEISRHWPEGVSAADAVADVRRDL